MNKLISILTTLMVFFIFTLGSAASYALQSIGNFTPQNSIEYLLVMKFEYAAFDKQSTEKFIEKESGEKVKESIKEETNEELGGVGIYEGYMEKR